MPMKLTVALLAVLLAPSSGSFLPKEVVSKPVVASTAKESPHIVPVPAKTEAKLPTPHGHPEAGAVKKVAPKPAVAAPKPAAKVEVKPVVAKVTDKVSPHIVPVPAKTAAKLPAAAGHPEGPQSKKAAQVAPKPAAVAPKAAPLPDPASAKPKVQTETKPVVALAKPVAKAAPLPDPASAKPKVVTKPAEIVPVAHVAVAVAHAAVPAATPTIHDHALSAQKSADEATKHLEQAKKAYAMTKANVQDTLKTGKKIEGTADKIKTLYTPPTKTPEAPKESAARSFAAPAVMVALLTAVLSYC